VPVTAVSVGDRARSTAASVLDARPAAVRRVAASSGEEQIFSVRRHHRAVVEDVGIDFAAQIHGLAPAAGGLAKGDVQIAAAVAVIAPPGEDGVAFVGCDECVSKAPFRFDAGVDRFAKAAISQGLRAKEPGGPGRRGAGAVRCEIETAVGDDGRVDFVRLAVDRRGKRFGDRPFATLAAADPDVEITALVVCIHRVGSHEVEPHAVRRD
jgi:hypothetical protein